MIREDEMRPPTFTVFIPAYNRARTLPRALESIERQTFRDLEVLVIDDGSTDATESVVREWQRRTDLTVRYYRQPNQGKHMAHNRALKEARGTFTVILDSDDALAPEALQRLLDHWNAIPSEERDRYAGVEGLCAYLSDGTIAGKPFPGDVMDSDYIEMKKIHGVAGDKKNAIRTDVLRRFLYPSFPGERYIRPSLVWNRIARQYRFRYVNEIIQYIEYQPDGLSSDRFRLRVSNPNGFRVYSREEAGIYGERGEWRAARSSYAKYVRYSLHCGIGFLSQRREAAHKGLWLRAVPKGVATWIGDRIRMRWRR
jgi:glycosyltransferase involved in cell wall biosynthesis